MSRSLGCYETNIRLLPKSQESIRICRRILHSSIFHKHVTIILRLSLCLGYGGVEVGDPKGMGIRVLAELTVGIPLFLMPLFDFSGFNHSQDEFRLGISYSL